MFGAVAGSSLALARTVSAVPVLALVGAVLCLVALAITLAGVDSHAGRSPGSGGRTG